MWFDQFFVTNTANLTMVEGSYNYLLVFLSVLLAASAFFFTLKMLESSRELPLKKYRTTAQVSGAITMAGGIWSMHFVGMLAFSMPHGMSYNPSITLVSLLPACFASYILLQRMMKKHAPSELGVLINAVIVGGGIGAMHYIGMAAMQMPMALKYDPYWFFASIVVAVALAYIALITQRSLTKILPSLSVSYANAISALVMGLAISGMHYTGMEAAVFILDAPLQQNMAMIQSNDSLAFGIVVFTLLISILILNVNAQFRSHQLVLEKSASESRLQAILDTAMDGVITIDAEGVIQGFNSAATAIFGWQEAETVGRSIMMLTPARFLESSELDFQKFVAEDSRNNTNAAREIFGLHKEGYEIPVRFGMGKVALIEEETLYVCFVSDISARRKMEEELRKSEERLSSLIRNIPGASFRCLLDENWTPLFLSDAIVDISGYPAQEYLSGSRSFGDWLHPDDDLRVREEMDALVGNSDTYVLEYRVIHRRGNIIWVLEKGTFIYDNTGKAIRIDGLMLDITERKLMEQELIEAKTKAEASAESKASFLANMSHEIRTPMNSIIGFTNLLLEEPLTDSSRKLLTTVSQAAHSLLHLLNDILDSAKLENRKLELEYMPFRLANCVDQVVSTLWLQAKKKDLQLNLSIDKSIPEVLLGAEARIRQVLMNLVGNGIKFTDQGAVSLSVLADPAREGWLRFEVRDSGIGIAADRIEAIFDPFTQADASMSRRFGGTGLGVTISKQLVDLMGGEMGVESELGKGSCFYFNLPLAQSRQETLSSPNTVYSLPQLRILIADDIEQNLTLLTMLLEKQNHTVVTAVNGLQAVSRYQEFAPDLVLMDIQMPEMDGLEASRAIRAFETEKNIKPKPIIALTASVLPRDRLLAAEAGMNGFANKPVDFAQLTSIIAQLLELAPAALPESAANSESIEPREYHAIHMNKGVSLWGDQQTYFSELKLFAEQHNNLPIELSRMLQREERDGLAVKTHALKGVSGNLALIPLNRALIDLETALQASDELSLTILQERVSKEWQAFLDELSGLDSSMGQEQARNGKGESIDSTTLLVVLRDWLESSEAGEMREDITSRLKESDLPEVICPSLRKASEAMDEFEFHKAIEHIKVAINLVKVGSE